MRFVFGRGVARVVALTVDEAATAAPPPSLAALLTLAAGAPLAALAVAARFA